MTSSPDLATLWSLPDLIAPGAGTAVASAGWGLEELGISLEAAPLDKGPEASLDWRSGFERGIEAGRSEAEQSLASPLLVLSHLIDRLDEAYAVWVRDRELDSSALALVVARQLTQHEFAGHPELVAGLVSRAFAELPGDVSVVARMHPEDLEVVQTSLVRESGASAAIVTWKADDTLSRGDVVLETPARLVDGRADTVLRQLYERIAHA
ncbi:MAG: hypothetical protein HOP12_15755 [Candidatus Eisenbacteria bacterium]|uniref:Flagellar assembly protein FliH/Type III secretion system HrpE domain-containing protein n=1 Tax=Eiseniibacteriota bacterium TaxID=2212470 RepID=A0A849SW68_UNCEI|nr:hypothetical protein [Candidatus Eisenbacteria bacterium]